MSLWRVSFPDLQICRRPRHKALLPFPFHSSRSRVKAMDFLNILPAGEFAFLPAPFMSRRERSLSQGQHPNPCSSGPPDPPCSCTRFLFTCFSLPPGSAGCLPPLWHCSLKHAVSCLRPLPAALTTSSWSRFFQSLT